jgi:hypothetical protein
MAMCGTIAAVQRIVENQRNRHKVLGGIGHGHFGDLVQCEVLLAYNHIKDRAAQSWDKPGLIYVQGLKNMSSDARGRIKSAEVIKRALRNCKTVHHPPVPADINQSIIKVHRPLQEGQTAVVFSCMITVSMQRCG